MHEVILRETVRRADLYPLRPIVQYLHTLRNDLLEIATQSIRPPIISCGLSFSPRSSL